MNLVLNQAQELALSELRQTRPDIRFVLVGAAALKAQIELHRFTADVDLAIVIEADELQPLMLSLGWRQQKLAHRWQHPVGALADVLPVSPSLLARGSVRLEAADRELNLLGFDLALSRAFTLPLKSGALVEVAPVPALMVMKAVAWLDRPYEREKDLGDIAQILERALVGDDERRWDPDHPIANSGLAHEDQSAFFVGYEAGVIAQPAHVQMLHEFISQVRDPAGVPFSQMLRLARYSGDDPEEILERRLGAFSLGLEHSRR